MNDNKSLQLVQLLTFSSIAASSAMLLSIVYEYTYFTIIYGKSLYFVSFNDYLTNSLTWLPYISLSIFGMILFNLEEILNSHLPYKKQQKISTEHLKQPLRDRIHNILFLTVMCSTVAVIPFLPQNSALVFIGFTVIFSFIIIIFIKISNISELVRAAKIKPQLIVYLFLSLLILITTAASGASRAVSDINQTDGDISIKGAPKNALLLRALEKGMLIRDIDNNELLLFSYDNKQIWKTQLPKLSEERRICLWYGWWCKKETTSIPPQLKSSK